MNKKLIAIILVLAMLVVAGVGATLAYFTDDAEKKNTFTVGNVEIELTEEKWDEAVENEENENMYPGQTIDKDPVVTNVGSNPCFVRISVTGLDQFGEDALIAYDELGEGWVDGEDGFFYYLTALDPEDETSALFTAITIPTSLENDAETEDIVVTAYAVQAQGIEIAGEAPTLAELQAWFNTIMPAETEEP